MTVTPIWDYSLLPIAGMDVDVIGASIDGGRSLSGISSAIDISGGGLWQITMRKVQVWGPDSHRYWNRLRNMLTGGARSIIIPQITDWIAPTPTTAGTYAGQPVPGPVRKIVPLADGSVFSDTSGIEQDTISASLAADAAVGAGTISITILAGGALVGGEVFEILHPTKLNRWYGVTDVDSATDPDPTTGAITYVIGIRPTLREAASSGSPALFAKPKCLMRLGSGQSMSWAPQKYWQFQPDVTFVEAF